MSFPKRAAATLPIFIGLLHAANALAAPSVSIDGQPTFVTSAGASAPTASAAPSAINYEVCIADESLRTLLSVTDASADLTLEAWVGEGNTDCTLTANRVGTAAQCWHAGTITAVSPSSFRIDARVQDIFSQIGRTAKDSAPHGDASACGTLSIGPHPLTLSYFFTHGTTGEGTSATNEIVAESVAAIATGDVAVTPGDAGAHVALLDGPSASAASYDVYCEPPPGNPAASDAGACAASVLVSTGVGSYGPGQPYKGPPPNSYVCATIPKGATTAEIQGLTNGATYAVAVSAVDIYGNHGDLSNVTCVTPVAGSHATSSGSCAVGPAKQGAGTTALVLGFVAVVIARIRRKRIAH